MTLFWLFGPPRYRTSLKALLIAQRRSWSTFHSLLLITLVLTGVAARIPVPVNVGGFGSGSFMHVHRSKASIYRCFGFLRFIPSRPSLFYYSPCSRTYICYLAGVDSLRKWKSPVFSIPDSSPMNASLCMGRRR